MIYIQGYQDKIYSLLNYIDIFIKIRYAGIQDNVQ